MGSFTAAATGGHSHQKYQIIIFSVALIALLSPQPTGSTASESLATPIYEDEVQSVGYEQSEWSWGITAGARQRPTTCVPIPSNLTLCRGISYHKMRLPNLLEHDSIREVTQQSVDWIHLLSIRCHPDTQVFLCSLFAPVCFDRPIWPCRSLCEAVQKGCQAKMASYGFGWPEMLNCEKFPPVNDLCINVITNASEDERCSACVQSETFASIFDSFCHASFVMQIKVEKAVVAGDHLKISAAKKKKIFKVIGLSKQETKDKMTFLLENFTRCNCNRTGLKPNGKKQGQFLVMGHKVGEKLSLRFVMKINQRSCEMREALRAIKNATICRNTSKVTDQKVAVFTENNKGQTDNLANALMSSKCLRHTRPTTPVRRPATVKPVTRRPGKFITPPKRHNIPTSLPRVTKAQHPGVTKVQRPGVTTKPSRSGMTKMVSFGATVKTPKLIQTVAPSTTTTIKKNDKRNKEKPELKTKETKTTMQMNVKHSRQKPNKRD